MMKTKYIAIIILVLTSLLFSAQPALAQDYEYTVHVRKDFGYSWANDIQGSFSIALIGDEENVKSVNFFIDDEILATLDSSPFRYQFNTEDFNPGAHQLYGEVFLKDGSSQLTPALIYDFLARETSSQQIKKIFLIIGGILLGVIAIVTFVQTVFLKGKKQGTREPGAPRSYGLMGGTICPKCGRPFPRHIYGMNLVVGRLDRCDNCGKWVMTVRATPEVLRMAEEAELEAVKADETETIRPAKERDNLEDTRFFDDL